MTKNDLMKIERRDKFCQAVESLGWTRRKSTSSHILYTRPDHPSLSIPCNRIIATGTRRNLVKLILSEEYYK